MEQISRRPDGLDLAAFMADGVRFGEHTCIVALGIGFDETKHPPAVEEGSTENATLVMELITRLRERGLDVTKPILAVLDGAKALSQAVKDMFGKPLIQRCQMSGTSCPNGSAPWLSGGCARPATPNRRCRPRACEPGRVDDRDLPGVLQERQALAGRDHGAALVRRRDAGGRSPVPPRQWPPAPAETPRRTRSLGTTSWFARSAAYPVHQVDASMPEMIITSQR